MITFLLNGRRSRHVGFTGKTFLIPRFSVWKSITKPCVKKYAGEVGMSRGTYLTKLEASLSAQQNKFQKFSSEMKNLWWHQMRLPKELSVHQAKTIHRLIICIRAQEVAKVMFPDKARLFESISLSENAIANSIEDINEYLSGQIFEKRRISKCFLSFGCNHWKNWHCAHINTYPGRNKRFVWPCRSSWTRFCSWHYSCFRR